MFQVYANQSSVGETYRESARPVRASAEELNNV